MAVDIQPRTRKDTQHCLSGTSLAKPFENPLAKMYFNLSNWNKLRVHFPKMRLLPSALSKHMFLHSAQGKKSPAEGLRRERQGQAPVPSGCKREMNQIPFWTLCCQAPSKKRPCPVAPALNLHSSCPSWRAGT